MRLWNDDIIVMLYGHGRTSRSGRSCKLAVLASSTHGCPLTACLASSKLSELSVFDLKRGPGHQTLAPYSASTEEANCVACKETEHPCAKFRDLPFEARFCV